MRPALAESWTVSPDQLAWTFQLRRGVTFHDGSPFTADDVVYSYRRIIDEKLANADKLSAVSGITAPDRSTVIVTLKQPTPNLLTNLGGFKGLAIVQRRNVESGEIATHPVGTGPFAFQSRRGGFRVAWPRSPGVKRGRGARLFSHPGRGAVYLRAFPAHQPRRGRALRGGRSQDPAGVTTTIAESTRVASWRLLLRNAATVVSATGLGVIVFVAVAANWITPFAVNDVDVPNALQPPSGQHWFGIDELGRDMLSRVLVAIQASMRVAVVSVAFTVVVGVTVGV